MLQDWGSCTAFLGGGDLLYHDRATARGNMRCLVATVGRARGRAAPKSF